MLPTADNALSTAPLIELRRLRAVQAWTLLGVAALSIVVGIVLFRRHDGEAMKAFFDGIAWQFVVWAVIDAVFAGVGIVQSAKVARRPPTPQAEADEFAAGEKLLRALHFNHRLNMLYVGTAGLLIAWGAVLRSPAFAGHGVGVLVQGGFLLVFDVIYIVRYARLMTAP